MIIGGLFEYGAVEIHSKCGKRIASVEMKGPPFPIESESPHTRNRRVGTQGKTEAKDALRSWLLELEGYVHQDAVAFDLQDRGGAGGDTTEAVTQIV
jgi:hypothetical protein